MRGGLRARDFEQHLGALVLDRLERADRARELHALLRPGHGRVEAVLRAAGALAGEHRARLVERLRERRAGAAGLAERLGGDARELDVRELARRVERLDRLHA